MCGRFLLTSDAGSLSELCGVQIDGIMPRWNIAPTQTVWCVQSGMKDRDVRPCRWGLIPRWSASGKASRLLINARSETAAEKPSFSDSMRHRRCVIPANGFYEWSGAKSERTPWCIARTDRKPFLMAGLWASSLGADGHSVETCCILTTRANAVMCPIHDRMPVVMNREQAEKWLDLQSVPSTDMMNLLQPCPDDWLEAWRVHPQVNRASFDEASCILPIAASTS